MTEDSRFIIYVTTEATPWAKVGGLADVMGSLPQAMAARGHHCILFLPRYGFIDPAAQGFEKCADQIQVDWSWRTEQISIWRNQMPVADQPDATVTVYLVESYKFFGNRHQVYPWNDLETEVASFEFFGEAVLQVIHRMGLPCHILHLNDWHTALVAEKLWDRRGWVSFFESIRSVLTIHNLAYQGIYNDKNRLATGIEYADYVTTVSPTYAKEIQSESGGAGLEALLQTASKSGKLNGILNGLDVTQFNPATDRALEQPYSVSTVQTNKPICKAALQQQLGLSEQADVPIFAVVSRLVQQKGIDILLPVIDNLLSRGDCQWVVVGNGNPNYESALTELAQEHPNLSVTIGFNDLLARQVYAGADCFLMPSLFEPCGLGQLIAMRYGTLPVVRRTGGLADTVVDLTTAPSEGTGFLFNDYDTGGLTYGIYQALEYYKLKVRGDDGIWAAAVERAMSQDFSWDKSAEAYEAVYQQLTPLAAISH